MWLIMQVLILLIGFIIANGKEEYIGKYKDFYNSLAQKGQWDDFVERHKNISVPYRTGQEFTCTENLDPSPTVPLSVHELRPADIKVIAALGDSVTAGFGEAATNIIQLPTEYRGLSWTIGVQKPMEEIVTIASVLQKYNANIQGGSTGNGGANSANAKLNVAISGAIGRGIPGQVNTLINRIKSDPNIDFDLDWKLVSLWIGGNDLCAACNGNEAQLPDVYTAYIKEALDNLKNSMPRTFVNMVHIVDVTKLYFVQDGDCQFWHDIVCRCGCSHDQTIRDLVTEYTRQYHAKVEALARTYDNLPTFTVVAQPFFINTEIPLVDGRPDRSYFSVDCFHYSEKAHDASAVALWNNMFEPVGEKSTSWTPGEKLICPTDRYPYLFTAHNSKLVREQWRHDHATRK